VEGLDDSFDEDDDSLGELGVEDSFVDDPSDDEDSLEDDPSDDESLEEESLEDGSLLEEPLDVDEVEDRLSFL
jgi:hypothetical protein